MINIGSIVNTHTGPARVIVMLPAFMKGGLHYPQALTQALGGALAYSDSPSASASGQGNQPAAPVAPVSTAAQGQLATFVDAADGQPVAGTTSADAANAKSNQGHNQGKASAWEPIGLDKIAALYKNSEEMAALHPKPNLKILG